MQAQERAAELVASLLRNTVLVADLETALKLRSYSAGAGNSDLQFVTLAGEFLSREGILQGGQTGEIASSVLHRKNQIAQTRSGSRGLPREKSMRFPPGATIPPASWKMRRPISRKPAREIQRINIAVSTLRGQTSMLEREVREGTKKAENLQWERGHHRNTPCQRPRKNSRASKRNSPTRDRTSGSCRRASRNCNRNWKSCAAMKRRPAGELNELRIKVATEKTAPEQPQQPTPADGGAALLELGELIEQRHRDIESYVVKSQNLTEESERIQGEIEATRGRTWKPTSRCKA